MTGDGGDESTTERFRCLCVKSFGGSEPAMEAVRAVQFGGPRDGVVLTAPLEGPHAAAAFEHLRSCGLQDHGGERFSLPPDQFRELIAAKDRARRDWHAARSRERQERLSRRLAEIQAPAPELAELPFEANHAMECAKRVGRLCTDAIGSHPFCAGLRAALAQQRDSSYCVQWTVSSSAFTEGVSPEVSDAMVELMEALGCSTARDQGEAGGDDHGQFTCVWRFSPRLSDPRISAVLRTLPQESTLASRAAGAVVVTDAPRTNCDGVLDADAPWSAASPTAALCCCCFGRAK